MPRIDELLGKRITGVFGLFWTSDSSENADYLFRLDDGRFIAFPEIYLSITDFDYRQPSDDHVLCLDASTSDPKLRERLFAAQITDLLVPRNADIRNPDQFLVRLSSGAFLFQESGDPIGCTTRCYLTTQPDDNDEPLTSIFDTKEWQRILHPKQA